MPSHLPSTLPSYRRLSRALACGLSALRAVASVLLHTPCTSCPQRCSQGHRRYAQAAHRYMCVRLRHQPKRCGDADSWLLPAHRPRQARILRRCSGKCHPRECYILCLANPYGSTTASGPAYRVRPRGRKPRNMVFQAIRRTTPYIWRKSGSHRS